MAYKKGLTGNQLKVLGGILMTIYHFNILFYPKLNQIPWLYACVLFIGPIVSPLFIYISSEGYFYTRDKQGYIRKILIGFFWVSFTKFMLINFLKLSRDYEELLFMNVFGGIFQAVIAMYLYDSILEAMGKRKWIKTVGLIMIIIVLLTSTIWLILLGNPFLLTMGINVFPLVVEGAPILPILGLLFHVFRQNQTMVLMIASIFVLPYFFTDILIGGFSGFIWPVVFFPILIYFYNGKAGIDFPKLFFYIYYPVHIVLFVLINSFLL